MFVTNVHISGYEVIAGSLATDKQFTGLVLRTEEIFQASTAGYVDYYAAEGAKVSSASIVYSVDESGRMSEYLQENADDISLSEDNYVTLKNDISSFSNGYDKFDFSDVYDFHDMMNGNILELSNQTLLSEMEALTAEDVGAFQRVYAAKSGIVEYYIDGYEAVTPETTADAHRKASDFGQRRFCAGHVCQAAVSYGPAIPCADREQLRKACHRHQRRFWLQIHSGRGENRTDGQHDSGILEV